jgi:hypothetical protein
MLETHDIAGRFPQLRDKILLTLSDGANGPGKTRIRLEKTAP